MIDRITLVFSKVCLVMMMSLSLCYAANDIDLARINQISTVQKQVLQSLYQQISVDRQNIVISQQKLKQLQLRRNQLHTGGVVPNVNSKMVENKQLALAEAKADLLNVSQLLADAEHKMAELNSAIVYYREKLRDAQADALNREKRKKDIESLQLRLDYLQTYFELQAEHIKELRTSNDLVRKIVQLEDDIYDSLGSLLYKKQNALREQHLLDIAEQIQKQRAALLVRLSSYNKKLEGYSEDERYSDPEAIGLALQIFQAEEQIYLDDQVLRLERYHDEVADLSALPDDDLTVREIDRYLSDVKRIKLHVMHVRKRLSSKEALIIKKLDIQKQSKVHQLITSVQYRKHEKMLSSLKSNYVNKIEQASQLVAQLDTQESTLNTLLNRNIAKRQGLPGIDLQEWNLLITKIKHIPVSSIGLLKSLRDHLLLSFRTITFFELIVLLMFELFWLVLWLLGRNYLGKLSEALRNRRQKMSMNIAYASIEIFRVNLPAIIFVGMLFTLFYICHVPFKVYRFIFYISIVWFVMRFIQGVSRLSLLETMSDVSGIDVKLYHRLKWAMSIGALILVFTILSNELNIAYEVRDFFNRIFMSFMFVLSIMLYRARYVIMRILSPYIDEKRPYLRRAVNLLTILVPLTLLSNAIVGLFGYLQLAWVMSYYQFMILFAITGYIIFRGIAVDVMELVSDIVIRNTKNGWLVSQAFLKPLDRVLRVSVFAMAWVVLFYSFGWGHESFVVQKLIDIVTYDFITLTGVNISLLSFFEFVVLAIIVVWAARWSREFSYRALFTDVHDQSIRNSFAAFTQYSTIIIGTFLTLRVLGIDISGFSYILGGLAVGLGFGLRDFANNIVSGIMMLIERPVREGDLISINEHEGIVTRIGLRSMTVKSFDYMEVMVPNAEILNKTFSNWTHQDSIVRTIIPIRVHRHDDPISVQNIVLKVLNELPAVISEPEPQVFIRKIDDVLIEMEARYFINLEKHMRVGVQSQVLFAIWERFAANGIRAPYPQQDVNLISQEGDTSTA